MKIGIIQPNIIPGDFPRNVRTLIEAYRTCLDEGAELVVSPALSLCGPCPDDLLLRTSYAAQNMHALHYLSQETGAVPLIVGTLVPAEGHQSGWGFYNAAFLVKNDEIQELAAQRHLDDFGIACDSRYLLSSELTECTPVEGLRLSILLGADDPSIIDPGNCDLILRLPTLPWHTGLIEEEEEAGAQLALSAGCPVITARMAGGQQRNIYPGASSLISKEGKLAARLACFEADTKTIHLDADHAAPLSPLPPHIEQVRIALATGLRDFVRKSGFSSVCLGLSGGIDSALVATLAVDALGRENVYGLALPGPYSSQGSLDDAFALARNLGIACEQVSITEPFEALQNALKNVFEGTKHDSTEENMQSRLRGISLMSYSNKFGHMLLTTGNKSELSVGYCTMYGDTCGGLNPIGDLYKTEVYELSKHINAASPDGEKIPRNTIEKAPSAELRPNQTDQDSLPPYDLLDSILRELVDNNISATDLIAMSPDRFDEQTVRKIQRLVTFSEWKRAQSAPILKVTPCSFGPERKIPFIHKFSD